MNYSAYASRSAASGGWILIVALVLAIVGTVLAYIFIMPKSKVKTLNKFWYFVHNVFNFKTLLVEKIFKALYVFLTIYVICAGFFQLFVSFLPGLLMLLLGPIVVRIVYEMIMMFILLVQNTTAIRNKLCDDDDDQPAPKVAAPKKAPKEYVFCSACGTRYDQAEGQCPACGRGSAPAQQTQPVQQPVQPQQPVQQIQQPAQPQQPVQPRPQQPMQAPQGQQPAAGFELPAYPAQRPAQPYPQTVERPTYQREHRRYQTPTQE